MRGERSDRANRMQEYVPPKESTLAAPRGEPQDRRVPLPLRLTYWLSILATLVAASVHVATFAGKAYYSVLCLVPLLLVVWPLVLWQWRRVPRGNLRSEVFGNIPRWLKITAALLLAYAFVNFFVCRALNRGGSPEPRSDGSYVLVVQPGDLRPLTAVEYRAARAVQVRMLSGELLVFFALAALLGKACWIKNGPAMADERLKPGN